MTMENSIGDFLKTYREQKSLSISELHRITGVSQPYLSQIENGKTPSVKIIQKIADGISQGSPRTYVDIYDELSKRAGYVPNLKKLTKEDLIPLDDIFNGKYRNQSAQDKLKKEQSIDNYKNDTSTPIFLDENNEGNFYFFKDNEAIPDETQQKIKDIIKTLLT